MRSTIAKGFTLVELMVVVAIVAILAVMAAPSYRDMIDRYRLRSATEEVVSVISNARAGAVKLDRQVKVTFGGSGKTWCVGAAAAALPAGGARAGDATACDCTDNSPVCSVDGEPLILAPGKHKNVALLGSPTELAFDGQLGLATGSGGALGTSSVSLTSPSTKYDLRVDVSPLGQATICVPSTSDAGVVGFQSC